MNQIRKYEVALLDTQVIPLMGKLVQMLTAQMQHGHIVLWAVVDPADDSGMMDAIEITIYGTGRNVAPDPRLTYLSTVQAGFVWHLYWQLA